IFAIVYFGGTALLTGSVLPAHDAGHAQIVVPGAEEEQTTAAPAEAAPAFDLASYVADPVKGQQVAGKCKACHTFEQGGANRVGPNLFGIYGGPVMHAQGFSYSSAMEAKKAEIGKWDEAHLQGYLESPKTYAP